IDIGLEAFWLKDAWGTPFRLERRKEKLAHPTGMSQFDEHDLVSAGPDRKFGTDDDVRLTANDLWQLGRILERHRLLDEIRWRDRDGALMKNLEMQRFGFPPAGAGGPGGPVGPAGFPPGLPVPTQAINGGFPTGAPVPGPAAVQDGKGPLAPVEGKDNGGSGG